jgi:hypothetical protein
MNMHRNKMLLVTPLAAIALAAVCVFSGGTAANAATPKHVISISAKTLGHFRSVWKEYGVPTKTQNKLLSNYAHRISWDSFKKATPVSKKTRTAEGIKTTVSTYADGSILVNTAEQPAVASGTSFEAIRPAASISGCKYTEQTHYDFTQECSVFTNVVVAEFGYNVTYYAVQGGPSHIVSHSGITDDCVGGACSAQSVITTRKTQSGSTPAETQGSLEWTIAGGGASKTYLLWFKVVGTAISSSNN